MLNTNIKMESPFTIQYFIIPALRDRLAKKNEVSESLSDSLLDELVEYLDL